VVPSVCLVHVKRGSGSCGFVITVYTVSLGARLVAASGVEWSALVYLDTVIKTTQPRQGPVAVRGIPGSSSSVRRAQTLPRCPACMSCLPCVLVQGVCRNGDGTEGSDTDERGAVRRVHHISEACSAQAYRHEGQLQPSHVCDQRLRHSALSTQHCVQVQVQVQIAPLTQGPAAAPERQAVAVVDRTLDRLPG
jgi:hypothetical protein